jgi:carbamoyl-phosphate synthase large subunit
MELRILLLGAGNRVSFCERLIAAGKTYKCEVSIFSVEIKNPVPISKYATILEGERWYSPNFCQSIIDICSERDIDIIIPLMDDATVALATHKDRIQQETGAWSVVSSTELCKTFLDKIESKEWFIANSVQVPLKNRSETTFPYIAKHRRGYGSRDQAVLSTDSQLISFFTENNIDDYILQPFITGTEYTIDAYVTQSGELLGAVSRVRLETINGEVSRGLTKKEPELLEEVKRILSVPGFAGPITLQAINAEDGSGWYFIEINPRFGGGCIQSIEAGANFAEALVAEYLGETPPDCSNWKEGLLMLRANQEIWSED